MDGFELDARDGRFVVEARWILLVETHYLKAAMFSSSSHRDYCKHQGKISYKFWK